MYRWVILLMCNIFSYKVLFRRMFLYNIKYTWRNDVHLSYSLANVIVYTILAAIAVTSNPHPITQYDFIQNKVYSVQFPS